MKSDISFLKKLNLLVPDKVSTRSTKCHVQLGDKVKVCGMPYTVIPSSISTKCGI